MADTELYPDKFGNQATLDKIVEGIRKIGSTEKLRLSVKSMGWRPRRRALDSIPGWAASVPEPSKPILQRQSRSCAT